MDLQSLSGALRRLADIPKSTISNFVVEKLDNGRKRWWLEFEHPFPEVRTTKDPRVRRWAKSSNRQGAEAEAWRLWLDCFVEVERAINKQTPVLRDYAVNDFWPSHALM